jgi:hypothetical protein
MILHGNIKKIEVLNLIKTRLEKVTLEKRTDSLQNFAKSLLRDLIAYETSNHQQTKSYDQFNLVQKNKNLYKKYTATKQPLCEKTQTKHHPKFSSSQA